MLSLLTRSNDASVTGSVSINLNVSTLLSPDFLTFDSNVKAGQRGTIVLELQKIDIFADLGAFFLRVISAAIVVTGFVLTGSAIFRCPISTATSLALI